MPGCSDGRAPAPPAPNAAMSRLTDYTSYADAQRALLGGRAVGAVRRRPRASLNIAHECIDRHAAAGRVAVRVAHADGRDESLSFRELVRVVGALRPLARRARRRRRATAWPSCSSRRCAFYAALFGAMKRGAIAVPLFTLFGPDGVRLRVDDCTPRLLVTNAEKADTRARHRRPRRGRGRRRAPGRARALSRALRGRDARRRPRGLPVHVGHHARAARGGASTRTAPSSR